MIRFLPDEPFPAYAYTPGRDPHPVRDERGHSYGVHAPAPAAPDADRWRDSHDYLRGIDLFNAGYYWEAHESWEGLWNACGRSGLVATLLQALIALAAVGLKVRAGNAKGAAAHVGRARRMLAEVMVGAPRLLGLDLADLAATVNRLTPAPPPGTAGHAVLPLTLRPG